MKVCEVMQAMHLKLRLKALFIDYLTIIVYLFVLLLIMMGVYFIFLEGIPEFTELQSHWTAFLTTVLPISIYYAVREAKPPYQTFGKKRAGLKVAYTSRPMMSSILRNIDKFLPWQLAHYAVIKGIYQDNFLLPSVLITYALSLTLPVIYVLMVAFRDDHRHLPDLLSSSQVVNAKKDNN